MEGKQGKLQETGKQKVNNVKGRKKVVLAKITIHCIPLV